MTGDRIDISDELSRICDKLGLKYTNVAEIVFRPGDLIATSYTLGEHGSPYIDPETDMAAVETREFRVLT